MTSLQFVLASYKGEQHDAGAAKQHIRDRFEEVWSSQFHWNLNCIFSPRLLVKIHRKTSILFSQLQLMRKTPQMPSMQ